MTVLTDRWKWPVAKRPELVIRPMPWEISQTGDGIERIVGTPSDMERGGEIGKLGCSTIVH